MADEAKDVVETKQKQRSIEEMERELKELEIRAKKAELEDLNERLLEREMKRETKRQRSLTNGATIKQLAANDKAAQTRCNHKKGGQGAEGIIGGQGDDSQYAVIKHRMPNGDVWVRCLRCGKTWKPPIESEFTVKGKLDEAGFTAAHREYAEAVAFQTRNIMSGSIQYRFSDGGKYFREVTKDVNLR